MRRDPCCSAAWHASHLRVLIADCSLGAERASSSAPGSSKEGPSTICAALPAPSQWCRQHISAAEASQCGITESDRSRGLFRHVHGVSLAEQRSGLSSASSASTAAEAEAAALSERSPSRSNSEAAADRAAATRLHSARAWRRGSHCGDRRVLKVATHTCRQRFLHFSRAAVAIRGGFTFVSFPEAIVAVWLGCIANAAHAARRGNGAQLGHMRGGGQTRWVSSAAAAAEVVEQPAVYSIDIITGTA